MGCVCKGDAAASLTGTDKAWGEQWVGMFLRILFIFALLSWQYQQHSSTAAL